MNAFKLASPFKPTGDQPKAIEKLVKGLQKGDKHQALLGVTGSGKSVVAKTDILLRNRKGSVSSQSIGSFIDGIFDLYPDKIEIIGDSEVILPENLPKDYQFETYSFDPKSKKSSWKRIKQYVRHKSPEKLYKLSTTCGRQITVTGDHNFFVLRRGNLQLISTSEMNQNDYIPLPLNISYEKEPLESLYLPDYLKEETRLYVTVPQFLPVFATHEKGVRSLLSPQKIYGIIHQAERISFRLYSQLSSIIPLITQKATIGTNKLAYEFPLHLSLTEGILRLFGYYIAEGHCEKYFIISSGDREIITDFQRTLDHLNVYVRLRPDTYDYQVNSLLLSNLFKNLCGRDSATKRLPSFWPQLSDDQLAHLLKAYFSGDGGVDGAAITCTTLSKQLASDLTYALLRFGIVARIRTKNVKIPQGNITRHYWIVSISGQKFLQIFQQKIGFVVERKNKRLAQVLGRKYNTNVDVIPALKSWLKDIRLRLQLTQKELAQKAHMERSYLSMLEKGYRIPSREVFSAILAALKDVALQKKRNDYFGELEERSNLLNLTWSSVKSIEVIAGEDFVYDFAVEDNETFLAGMGGMFVHNTFTMANIVAKLQRPTLVIAHNKTLAAQLCSEFKEFFPENAVSYFVSYYDYYQPEAYLPSSDTYIEKDASINEEINKFRHAATVNLLTRRDVLIVASVSCIYGLGDVEEYGKFAIDLKVGDERKRDKLLRHLSDIQYVRSQLEFKQGMFHVLGDTLEIFPPDRDTIFRLEFFGDEIEKIVEADSFTGEVLRELESVKIFPAKHDVTSKEKIEAAASRIREDLAQRYNELKAQGKLLEAERIKTRTEYDLEILLETGYVTGIENYTRYFSNRPSGAPSATLLDYFPDDFLLFVDESHMTIPQIGGMHNGNFSRKQTLIDYGFRLPSAHDNRPLKFEEFEEAVNQAVYVSATPGPYELGKAKGKIVEQIIRPTGLIDPEVEVRPSKHQIDNLLSEIQKRVKVKERVLVTTLTKRSAEDLTEYLTDAGIKVRYLHSDIDTLERIEILRDLRLGKFDVLVGINLLREGLDLPEVSLIGILDADKEGFLRSEGALIQTIGRAARNVHGFVIMYADRITQAMKKAIDETNRRRGIQQEYNKKHGITPQTILKAVKDIAMGREKQQMTTGERHIDPKKIPKEEMGRFIKELEDQMDLAAQNLEFEKAAELRDEIDHLREEFKV